MKTIKKPTDEQLQRLMNLIALPATLDEEGIYDRFSCYGWEYFTKEYCEWLEKKYPELYDRAKTDNDLSPIECQFWWKDDDEDSTGYEAFKKNAEYIYTHEDALKMVCNELREFYDDFDEYKEEMEIEDDRWDEDFIPFDSEDDYKSQLLTLFKEVGYIDDDEDFDFDAALDDKGKKKKKPMLVNIQSIEETEDGINVNVMHIDKGFIGLSIHIDDESQLNGCKEGDQAYFDESTNTFTLAAEDFDFDAALGPMSKNVKKLLGDLAASGAQIHGVAPGGGIGGRLNVDKDGNIKGGDDWSKLIGDLTRAAANTESKNAESDEFDKQKNWKDVPDFDPKAAAEKRRREREEMKKDDEIDVESFEQDFKAMLGDDFDFERDVE